MCNICDTFYNPDVEDDYPASDEALDALRRKLTGTVNDVLLTVVFTDGRQVSVEAVLNPDGTPAALRDGFLHAEDATMRTYTFPNVSHWYSESL